MIARLNGTLVEKHPNRLIVDVHGVGYECMCRYRPSTACPAGRRVSLQVHTHTRDMLALFGFAIELGQIFDRLIAISGIGPRLRSPSCRGSSRATWCAPCR
jgi:Holliday junction DNA helicase RuvA